MRAAPLLLCLLAACATSTQTGLSNAPGGTRPWMPEDRKHDAIANGPESCPPPGSERDDPLPGRWPKCPEHGAAAAPSARPASPARPGSR